MTTIQIIYIVGIIANVILSFYDDRDEDKTLGDIFKILLVSLFSWVIFIGHIMAIIIDKWDDVIIKGKK